MAADLAGRSTREVEPPRWNDLTRPASHGCTSDQTISFSGTTVYAGTDAAPGPYDFTVNASSSICESVTAGAGSGTISGDLTGSLVYTRTANIIQASATVQIGPGPGRTIFIICYVVITSWPVQSFIKGCIWV